MKKQNLLPQIIITGLCMILYLGCDTRLETVKPTACFDYTPISGIKVGDVVNFTNCSKDGETYEWNFGDGGTSVATDPTHQFTTAGTFTVTLIVRNKNLADQIDKTITVTSNVNVIACFTMSPNPAAVSQTVNFTNCSTGADSYEWDIDGDGTIDDTGANPAYYFNNAGTYNVKLKAKKGTSFDEVTKQLTITGSIVIDPKVYALPITWTKHYTNTFDASGDWSEGTTSDYSAIISGGIYSITNFSTESTWYFWTNNYGMPEITKNYDVEIYSKIDFDIVTQGNGLFCAVNESTFDGYFLKMAALEGTNYYTWGNKNNEPWATDFFTTGLGTIGDYNKLTIRKYENTLYFFINEIFTGKTVPFEGNYGQKFGFIVGANSKLSTEWISIWNMDLGSRKSATDKLFTKVSEEDIRNNDKTLEDQIHYPIRGIQAKKIEKASSTLK